MQYLMNERKAKAAAHVWLGADTACRMWSTGGMDTSKPAWITAASPMGRRVCTMCESAPIREAARIAATLN